MKLSSAFPEEFRALVDVSEPLIERLPPRDWSDHIIYVVDCPLEFENGTSPTPIQVNVVPKAMAIAREEVTANKHPDHERVLVALRAKRPFHVWLVICRSDNDMLVKEVTLHYPQSPGGTA